VEYAGAIHDPVAAVIFCESVPVDYNYVHGVAVVSEGHVVGIDLGMLIEAQNKTAMRLVEGD
jgi:hypothetical protein